MSKLSELFAGYIKFWRRKTFLSFSFHIFFILLFFVRVLIGNSPFFVTYKNTNYWLVWDNNPPKGSILQQDLLDARYEWDKLTCDHIVWPLFRLSEDNYHSDQEWRAPLTRDGQRFHLLGTYELGRDVLSSCLFGMQKSMAVAFIAIAIALIIGLPLGVGGYFYSIHGLILDKLSSLVFLFSCLCLAYIFIVSLELKYFSFTTLCITFLILCLLIYFFSKKQEQFLTINTDYFLLRWIELMKSLPLLLILLLVLQWFKKPDLYSLSILIGIFMSVSIAKYARFITLSESKENYIQSLMALGYTNSRIVFFHLLPKVLTSLAPMIALSISSIVLLESSISYLGLGLPVEEVSLGNMMQTSKNYNSAWWVVLFPGMFIFWIVYCFQSLNAKNFNKEVV
ncbi:MAG: ABC transporter permease subunit [Saprospiraceae bacterium]